MNGKNPMDMEEVFLDVNLSSYKTSNFVKFYKSNLPEDLPVDGVLGNDFLSRFNIYISYHV